MGGYCGADYEAVEAMRTGTYLPDGHLASTSYMMTGETDQATETASNNSLGKPVRPSTGLVRLTFRPSDGQHLLLFCHVLY